MYHRSGAVSPFLFAMKNELKRRVWEGASCILCIDLGKVENSQRSPEPFVMIGEPSPVCSLLWLHQNGNVRVHRVGLKYQRANPLSKAMKFSCFSGTLGGKGRVYQ